MTKIQRWHAASAAISADGVEGIWAASRLVGYETAMAMLVTLLREHYNRLMLPDADDALGKVNYLLASKGLLDMACYSPSLGRGCIFNEDSLIVHVIDVEKMYEPELVKEDDLNMLLQMPHDTVTCPAGLAPYTKVYNEMLRDHHAFLASYNR